jgi:hypothetical protein
LEYHRKQKYFNEISLDLQSKQEGRPTIALPPLLCSSLSHVEEAKLIAIQIIYIRAIKEIKTLTRRTRIRCT